MMNNGEHERVIGLISRAYRNGCRAGFVCASIIWLAVYLLVTT